MTLTSGTPQSLLGSDDSDEHLPPSNPSPCPLLQLQNKPLISDKSI